MVCTSQVKSGAFASVEYCEVVFVDECVYDVAAGVAVVVPPGWVLGVDVAHDKDRGWKLVD